MVKSCLMICVLALTCCGCARLFARSTKLKTDERVSSGSLPERGLLVTEVFKDSPAEAAGVLPNDVITNYGSYEIIDDAKFFEARNHYENNQIPDVEIVVWRGTSRMTARVHSGWLGVMSVDNDRESKTFGALMARVNVESEMWEYKHDKDPRITQDVVQTLANAKMLVDTAERKGLMSPTQILINRIYLILDSATPAEQKYQTEMLTQLVAVQPANFIHSLANDKFFSNHRNHAAIFCFQHLLKSKPDDVSTRLDMSIAYNRIQMYDEANKAVDYVFKNLRFSDYGEWVGNVSKATSALGRRDFATALEFGEKAFEYRKETYTSFISLLAAAQMGDCEKFRRTVQTLKATLPKDYERMKFQLAGGEALCLVKANRKHEAEELTRQWQNESSKDMRFIAWRDYPAGVDVPNNWSELTKR